MDKKSRTSTGHVGYLGTPPTERLCEFEEVHTDAETGQTVAKYDRQSVPLSVALPTFIAQQRGVDPTELPPMYDCIDIDALERAVGDGADCDVTVRFQYAGYTVEIDGERLSVQPAER